MQVDTRATTRNQCAKAGTQDTGHDPLQSGVGHDLKGVHDGGWDCFVPTKVRKTNRQNQGALRRDPPPLQGKCVWVLAWAPPSGLGALASHTLCL